METAERIERIERRLKLTIVAFLAALLVLFLTAWRSQTDLQENLRVRQITVIDENGRERIQIGAPLPDPIIQGKRLKRSSPISGILLFDTKGNERSGYATSDVYGEVFLALDSEKGQESLFLVNPGGGGHLSVYDNSGNFARLGVLRGQPTLELKRKGETVFQKP